MDQTTAGILALYAILGVTVLALWLRHRSVLRQRDRMMYRMGDLQSDLSDTTPVSYTHLTLPTTSMV